MSIVLQRIDFSATETLVSILRDADEDEQRVRDTLADEAYTSYAALAGEQLVGAVTVRWQEDESEIEYIAVVPARRGSGYGKAIMAVVLEEARRRNVRSLLVGTGNSSPYHIAFYQKCGFRMDHVRKDFFRYIQPPVFENGILLQDMLVFRWENEQ
ncbi:putative N-acetyltransferase YvbK [Reticulibacter mediterranei]|uniref:Putative N-acetyltransferase YvbK n=1 Tax=Reticulibacter mediterranei TaxID=2778369 RepID=A0A8J3IJF3_9CHLR|nr:GNAT family N-acetyltransferase [Reticulibacter mediterranei]GHO91276.1 putative N-acetyltransferase YvbK [Reticulibacter mediterranei]